MKIYGKMSSILEFAISKLAYVLVFMKVWEKTFGPFLRHFWLIKVKLKMKMKKYGKMSSIFELSKSKLGYVAVFMKICKKMFDPFFKTFFFDY